MVDLSPPPSVIASKLGDFELHIWAAATQLDLFAEAGAPVRVSAPDLSLLWQAVMMSVGALDMTLSIDEARGLSQFLRAVVVQKCRALGAAPEGGA